MDIEMGSDTLSYLQSIEPTLRADYPILHLVVDPVTMTDRSLIHRFLAQIGYVPRATSESPTREEWVFYHPDGERL